MQSKTISLLETVLNVASGFLISMIVWQFIVAPLYNIPVTVTQNLGITGIFTISAVIRGYFWRRFFANELHKKLTKP